MLRSSTCVGLATLLACAAAYSQETRGSIFGRVTDPSGSLIPKADIRVINVDTNSTTSLETNDSGYFEASLLLPGTYRVTIEAAGFKQSLRDGITLSVSSRADASMQLQVGGSAETITVNSQSPLIDTSAVSSGRVVDNRSLMDLPVLGNSAILLVKFAPGMQSGGVNNYLGLHSNSGGSDYSTSGNVGGNEWSIDGVPNNGNSRRAAYLPYSDTIQEFKVETSSFDASIGHTTGASIAMFSKAGTNSIHGTLTEQHWQQRWNGSPFFVKQLYYRRINEAEAAGDTALANTLRGTDKQSSGRSNNWAATVGGPVVIPKLYNGKNKLFFFFSYNGFKDVKTEDANSINRTIPTLAERQGDFSQLLRVPNSARYQLHDPLTTRVDTTNPGHFIREPFPGNIIPRSRFQNPTYNAYLKLLPTPNNSQPLDREQRNNYLATATPYNWDYKSYSNRVDYQLSERHRFFGRWSFNDFIEDRGDWTYESARGLHSNGLNRNNKGGTVDWVWTPSSRTILDFAVAINQFREGDLITTPRSFKPTDLGFPAYLDQKAGDQQILPFLDFDAYQDIGRGGIPTFTRSRMLTAKSDITHIRGNHSLRGGIDVRSHFRTGGGGGNTSGNYRFTNTWTRRSTDTARYPVGDFGHTWASFLMGYPSGMTIATNDTYATHNPYYGLYVQDNWRLTSKLTLNLGLRTEFEMGPDERYNRIISDFDAGAVLPITDAAKAAYARSQVVELPASQFNVLGGSLYAGVDGVSRRLWKNQLMWLPRIGVSYQIANRTVLRGGYGIFFDTLNTLNDGPGQTNFSRTTSTIISTDNGVNWLVADPLNGRPPITDPFPIRSDGSRYDMPTREVLGLMAVASRNFNFDSRDRERARQQRWRFGVQQQLGSSMVLEVAYAGSYSDRVYLDRRLNFLPEKYWQGGMTRNNALASNLNGNVTNPFLITNFESLRQTNPAVYQDMSTQGFFTGAIIAKHRLLRPFPHMGTDLIYGGANVGEVKIHSLEVSFEKRMSKGINFNFSYTGMRGREADVYLNEFDQAPSWRTTNDGRPHRIIATTIAELPLGRGRALFNHGIAGRILEGMQVGVTYEWQPGPLIDFGNLFYYGELNQIQSNTPTLDAWFNTANFEKDPARTPAAYHKRVFPTRIDGLRRDMTNQWNTNFQKEIRIREGMVFQLRLDALNVQNRSQFNAPDTGPTSTNFGRITSQTAATNRFIQIQGRLRF